MSKQVAIKPAAPKRQPRVETAYSLTIANKAALVRKSDHLLTLSAKAKGKEYSGGVFLDVAWHIQTADQFHTGNFYAANVQIYRGPPNVNDPNDQRVKAKADRYINVKLSTLAGKGADFLTIGNEAFTKEINRLIDEDVIIKPHEIKPLIRTGYSLKNKEKRGQLREDPIVDLKLEWDSYPMDYFKTSLAGKPKMTIKDADKPICKDGKIVDYEPAVVTYDDGKTAAVCRENAHLFITNSSILVDLTVAIGTCFVSKLMASMPIPITSMVVKHIPDTEVARYEEDDDEFEILDNSGQATAPVSIEPLIEGNNGEKVL
jgi:hypothetical protein